MVVIVMLAILRLTGGQDAGCVGEGNGEGATS